MNEIFQSPHHGEVLPVIVRGFLKGAVIFQSQMEVSEENLDSLVESMVAEHAQECAEGRLGMIEFEFPDGEFYRIGPDPTNMVDPMRML